MTAADTAARAEFLAGRKKGIGGSDVAALLGLSPYKTPEQLWLEKTGQVEDDGGDTYHTRRGRMFEPVIRTLYAEQHPEVVLELSRAQSVHPTYPWMLANYDGVAFAALAETPTRVVEIKAPSIGAYRKIQREGMKQEWVLQMQHYLAVSGFAEGTFVVFCADMCELIEFNVPRDDELIAMLVEREREFWTLVETMTPPPAVVREFADAPKIEIVGTVTKRTDDEFLAAVAALREATELADTAGTLKDEAKARVLALAGSTPGIYETPTARIYYTAKKGRTSLDVAALLADTPLTKNGVAVALHNFFANEMDDEAAAGRYTERVMAAIEADESAFVRLADYEKLGKASTEFRTYWLGGAA